MREHLNRLQLNVSPHPQSCEQARSEILAFFGRGRLDLRPLDDFMFAVGEALANAVEHSGALTPITVECRIDREKIVARISDCGCGIGYIPKKPHLPAPFAERGRGLAIMAHYADIFQVESAPSRGTTVTLGLYTGAEAVTHSRSA